MEQATDFLTTPSDDSLRIDIPTSSDFQPDPIPRQTPPNDFISTVAGILGDTGFDALAHPLRVLAARS